MKVYVELIYNDNIKSSTETELIYDAQKVTDDCFIVGASGTELIQNPQEFLTKLREKMISNGDIRDADALIMKMGEIYQCYPTDMNENPLEIQSKFQWIEDNFLTNNK